ncbi:hypothetical protein PR048_002639 [Dryococelus australis]|uniref:Uncharacterized protein n=1 Tax=Dryococelus australis TaxID=614101 RepID=A0ABQ9IN50_9NEOP|nr:hypothetical protein PR048_002639 [Dryococelus australis]
MMAWADRWYQGDHVAGGWDYSALRPMRPQDKNFMVKKFSYMVMIRADDDWTGWLTVLAICLLAWRIRLLSRGLSHLDSYREAGCGECRRPGRVCSYNRGKVRVPVLIIADCLRAKTVLLRSTEEVCLRFLHGTHTCSNSATKSSQRQWPSRELGDPGWRELLKGWNRDKNLGESTTSKANWSGEIWMALNIDALTVDEGEASARMKGWGKTGDPGENPQISGIVRHDSHMRKSGSGPAENRARFAWEGGELFCPDRDSSPTGILSPPHRNSPGPGFPRIRTCNQTPSARTQLISLSAGPSWHPRPRTRRPPPPSLSRRKVEEQQKRDKEEEKRQEREDGRRTEGTAEKKI